MSDTIAAIATGGVIAAIGIVRVSGSHAITISDRVFRAANKTRLSDAENRRMYYGEIVGTDGRLLDLCMCMISRAPYSYTGEDTAEFHCHGSPVLLAEILKTLFSLGARQALAGEFTKRAFLNGRMDLTQAEAVIDLIEAETAAAAQNAAGQLRGAVSLKLNSVYSALTDIMAHFHAVIDYPDEDIDEFQMQSYIETLRGVEDELGRMLATHERGKVLRDGVPTAVIGRPNTGKSSLLNALLGYERAIVTDIAGTTRDTIEEKVLFGWTLLRLIDTAGLRDTSDTIEKLGVERTRAAICGAGLVIIVLDGSQPLQDSDYDAFRSVPQGVSKIAAINKSDLPQVITANNKSDLPQAITTDGPESLCPESLCPELLCPESLCAESLCPESLCAESLCAEFGVDYCHISALTGAGLPDLEAGIKKLLPELSGPPSGEIITNARQADAIARAADAVRRAVAAVTDSVTPDAVLTDVEDAISAIGEITGKLMREDIVTRIFERFCVGK